MPPSDPSDVRRIDADDITPDSTVEATDGLVTRRVDPDERVSTAVVMAIAEALDADPTSLTPPLHDAIDPEAIDRLFDRSSSRSANLRFEFELYGCRVAVDGDRRLRVRRIA